LTVIGHGSDDSVDVVAVVDVAVADQEHRVLTDIDLVLACADERSRPRIDVELAVLQLDDDASRGADLLADYNRVAAGSQKDDARFHGADTLVSPEYNKGFAGSRIFTPDSPQPKPLKTPLH
jgi:hypothetical protein